MFDSWVLSAPDTRGPRLGQVGRRQVQAVICCCPSEDVPRRRHPARTNTRGESVAEGHQSRNAL